MPATMTSAVSIEWPASPPQGVSPATFISFISCSFLAHLRNFQDEEAADHQPDEEHGEYDRVPPRQAEQLRPVVELDQKTPDKTSKDPEPGARKVPEAHEQPGPPRRN